MRWRCLQVKYGIHECFLSIWSFSRNVCLLLHNQIDCIQESITATEICILLLKNRLRIVYLSFEYCAENRGILKGRSAGHSFLMNI